MNSQTHELFAALELVNRKDLAALEAATRLQPSLGELWPAFIEFLEQRANTSARALDTARRTP